MTESIQDAINNLFKETMYQNQDVKQGISVSFLSRMTMLKLAAGMIDENDPAVIDAKKELENSVNYAGMSKEEIVSLAKDEPKIWAEALNQNLRLYIAANSNPNSNNLTSFFTHWFDAAMEQAVTQKTFDGGLVDSPDDNYYYSARHVSADRSNNAICVVTAEIFADKPQQTLFVDLQYPPMEDEKFKFGEDRIKYVVINLTAVRSADGVRISYDFYRDGWKIEQASIHEWAADDKICDEGWVEVAFVQAWASEIKNESVETSQITKIKI